jgi:ankyrin repeat protein
VTLLIKKGADVNRTYYQGYSPLHQAASMGDSYVTNLLLRHGARQDVREEDHGMTPLFLAVQSGDVDTVRCLLRDASISDDSKYTVV